MISKHEQIAKLITWYDLGARKWKLVQKKELQIQKMGFTGEGLAQKYLPF